MEASKKSTTQVCSIELPMEGDALRRQLGEIREPFVFLFGGEAWPAALFEQAVSVLKRQPRHGAVGIHGSGILIRPEILRALTLTDEGTIELELIFDALEAARICSWVALSPHVLSISSATRQEKVEEDSFTVQDIVFQREAPGGRSIFTEPEMVDAASLNDSLNQLNDLLARKDFNSVISIANQLLLRERANPDLYLLRGYCEISCGFHEEAVRSAFAAYQLAPENPSVQNFFKEVWGALKGLSGGR